MSLRRVTHDRTLSGHYVSNGTEIWRTDMSGFDLLITNTSDEFAYGAIADKTILCALAKKN